MQDSVFQFSTEASRIQSFGEDILNESKHTLARAGFFYCRHQSFIKCYSCFLIINVDDISPDIDIVAFHEEKQPQCQYISKYFPALYPEVNTRSKRFLSYNSLKYERERLQTFIEWPNPWLFPEDLAASGFYYLRYLDHCACVFCRVIIGKWEQEDTAMGEHKRHAPHCSFVRGQPVGNVPLRHSEILDKLPLDGEEPPTPATVSFEERKRKNATDQFNSISGRLMSGSYAECSKSFFMNYIKLN